MTQNEYDASAAVKLHLIDRDVAAAEGLRVAVCSGLAYEPADDADRPGERVACPACERVAFLLSRRRMMASIASRN